MIHVRTVEHAGRHRLKLSFSDGTEGVANLMGFLDRPALSALRDVTIFSQAHVDAGTVCWPSGLDIAAEVLYALAHDLEIPRTHDEAKRNEQLVTLKELRQIAGRTQTDVAEEMGVAQGEISRLERRDDAKLSTLRAYVDALGGELELTARLGDRSVALQAFLPATSSTVTAQRQRAAAKTKAPAKKRTVPKAKRA